MAPDIASSLSPGEIRIVQLPPSQRLDDCLLAVWSWLRWSERFVHFLLVSYQDHEDPEMQQSLEKQNKSSTET